MKTIALSNAEKGCGSEYWRTILPIRHCRSQLRLRGIDIVEPDPWHELENEDYAATVFYRLIHSEFMAIPFHFLMRGKMTIAWDMDDNFQAVPKWSPVNKIIGPMDLLAAHQSIAIAKKISASTDILKEALGFPEKTTVLPNLIDLSDFRRIERRDRITIMFAGSNTHGEDLRVVVPALRHARKQFKSLIDIVFVGHCPTYIAEDKAIDPIVMGWAPVEHYPMQLSLLAPDIGLAPLASDEGSLPFNRCKSPIKWMEYTAAGAVTIASNIPPYAPVIDDGHTGYLCDTEDDWVYKLERAIDKHIYGGKDRVLENATREVRRNHSWESAEKRDIWVNYFESLVS